MSAPALGDAIGSFDLRISCRQLINLDVMSLSDPVVQVFQLNSTGQPVLLGATEKISDSLNPDFTRTVRVVYCFEVVQQLVFRVLDDDGASGHELIGEATCVLTDIVLSDSLSFTATLTLPAGATRKGKGPRGSITVSAEDVSGRRSLLRLQFSALALDKKDLLGKSDGFLVLSRVRANGITAAIVKTEVVKNSLNPTWQPLSTSSAALYGNDEAAIVEIQCFDWNKSSPAELIGVVRVPAAELLKPGTWELINPKKQAKKKGYRNSGTLRLNSAVVTPTASFLDYLGAGLHITACVGIDCTASNGAPTFATSLHYLSPYQPNQYQRAIASVGAVVEPYSSNRAFLAYGYGGMTPVHNVVNHCFAFNMNEMAPVIPAGTAGLLNSYAISMPQIRLSGPTLFAPLISKVASYAAAAKAARSIEYFVLLLLTDGVYQDRQATIDAIVEASTLPMSIIIVGVGSADFSRMSELDADDKPLVSSRGVRMARDIVQFVPFLTFEQSPPGSLAAEVLHELPGQVESYFASVGFVPPPKAAPVKAAVPPIVVSSSSAEAPPSYEADIARAAASIELDDASSDDEGGSHTMAYPHLHA